MKKVTLTEIRRNVVSGGGTYKKEKFLLNGNDAYRVNGKLMTRAEMVERYRLGTLREK